MPMSIPGTAGHQAHHRSHHEAPPSKQWLFIPLHSRAQRAESGWTRCARRNRSGLNAHEDFENATGSSWPRAASPFHPSVGRSERSQVGPVARAETGVGSMPMRISRTQRVQAGPAQQAPPTKNACGLRRGDTVFSTRSDSTPSQTHTSRRSPAQYAGNHPPWSCAGYSCPARAPLAWCSPR